MLNFPIVAIRIVFCALVLGAVTPLFAQFEMKRDVLYGGITVGMTRAEVDSIADDDGWTATRASAREVTYKMKGDAIDETRHFRFRDGVVRSIAATIVMKAKAMKMMPGMFRLAQELLKNRADRVERKGGATIYYHSASDGSKVKTVWRQMSKSKASIEATVL